MLLARLKAPEAQGLADKLQMAAWMISLLKDGRGDAATAAGELLGHGWSLVQAAGEYFYADSRLEKAIDDKYRSIEAVKKIRGLQAQKARWIKSLAEQTAVRDSLLGWLSRVVLARAPESSELQAGGRLRRSLLDKVLLAKLLAAIADYVAGQVTEQIPKGWVPDVGGFLTQKLLQPYDDASNETVGLFLANTDYARIHAVSIGVETRLAARKAAMGREFERATQWRIAEDTAQALAANASECSQAVLNVLAVGYAAPKLADAAKYLEKVHKAIDAAATSVRFAEECFTYSGILSKTSDTVLEAVAEAAGVAPRVTDRGPGSGRSLARSHPLGPAPRRARGGRAVARPGRRHRLDGVRAPRGPGPRRGARRAGARGARVRRLAGREPRPAAGGGGERSRGHGRAARAGVGVARGGGRGPGDGAREPREADGAGRDRRVDGGGRGAARAHGCAAGPHRRGGPGRGAPGAGPRRRAARGDRGEAEGRGPRHLSCGSGRGPAVATPRRRGRGARRRAAGTGPRPLEGAGSEDRSRSRRRRPCRRRPSPRSPCPAP